MATRKAVVLPSWTADQRDDLAVAHGEADAPSACT